MGENDQLHPAASDGKDEESSLQNTNEQAAGEEEEVEVEDKSARPSTTTAQFYYYQNPTTGTVSTTPLSVAQLVKLLVPVRMGMAAILPPHTQCLAVGNNNNTSGSGGSTEAAAAAAATFGEWKPVSTVDVLKEAACTQWFLTGGGRNTGSSEATRTEDDGEGEANKKAESATTKGPMTCRSLLEEYNQVTTPAEKSQMLVFAPEITSEWTPVEKLPHLQLVLQALQPPPPPASFLSDASSPDPTIPAESNNDDDDDDDEPLKDSAVQDELEAFLSSTAAATGGGKDGLDDNDDDDDDHAYESDGGTRYVKDPLSGHWIHEALAPPRTENKTASSKPAAKSATSNGGKDSNPSKKTHKKAKFSKRNARNWVYVTGLPTNNSSNNRSNNIDDLTSEIHKFFGKVGLLDLDPETLQPKMKLYKNPDGTLKGDASLCYARPESVELALQVLDESPWDEHHLIRVARATFEAKATNNEDGDTNTASNDSGNHTNNTGNNKRQRKNISQAQRKVARLALLQAQDEGFGERLAGGRKGLRIVVVKHMLDGIPEADWESVIQEYCQELDAPVEKITCISKTKVVIVKFIEPTAASEAVEAWNGKVNPTSSSRHQGGGVRKIEAFYWDGVTDYTHSSELHNPEEEAKRHEDFGKWLDDQGEGDLPPELRLQVAEDH